MSTSSETTPAKTNVRLADKEKRRIVQMYTRRREPLSIRMIALETGRSYGAVHRVLVAANVEIRGQGGARKKPAAKPVN